MGCFVAPMVTAMAAGCAAGCNDRREARKLWSRLAVCEGAVALVSAVEHAVHGEIVAEWPFLTALATTESRQILYRELATEGVALALAGVALWVLWTGLRHYARKNRAVRPA